MNRDLVTLAAGIILGGVLSTKPGRELIKSAVNGSFLPQLSEGEGEGDEKAAQKMSEDKSDKDEE